MSTYKPGQGTNGEQIWFPKLTGTSPASILDVSHLIAKRTTASEADVYLVMMALVDAIPDLLAEGKTIKLERFGTFRLHAKVKTENSPEKITRRNIKEIRLSFRPDNEMKKALQNIRISPEK